MSATLVSPAARVVVEQAPAAAYKDAHNHAFRQSARKTEQWTDRAGKTHHYVPTFLSGQRKKVLSDQGKEAVAFYNDPFYLDTGPMFLVYAGLMDANDPLMKEAVAYFRDRFGVFPIC